MSNLEQAYQIEKNRQDLVAKRPTKGALAYARFLCSCANDATGGGFTATDIEVLREYPFLKEVLDDESK